MKSIRRIFRNTIRLTFGLNCDSILNEIVRNKKMNKNESAPNLDYLNKLSWFKKEQERLKKEKLEKKAKQDIAIRLKMKIPPSF